MNPSKGASQCSVNVCFGFFLTNVWNKTAIVFNVLSFCVREELSQGHQYYYTSPGSQVTNTSHAADVGDVLAPMQTYLIDLLCFIRKKFPNKTTKSQMYISETQGTMTSKISGRNVHSAISKPCTTPVWSDPTVSKFISTVFRGNSNRIIHRNHGWSISTESKWNFPNRLNFSVENKDPLGLVFLKQNG